VTDESRVVVERSEYEPYGKVLNRPLKDGPGYTGHVEDTATGLLYMQQRYMDPDVPRFLSVDPVTPYSDPVGQFNRYRYAANNPYRFTDPDGRREREWESLNAHSSNFTSAGTGFSMVGKMGPIDRGFDGSKRNLKAWPVPGHGNLNKADKPREGKGEFGTPRNTSRGASTHTGIDIEAPVGARVVAAEDGVVVNIKPNPSTTYGSQVVIKHGDGTFTQYAHLNSITVTPGDPVNGGNDIGTVGRSGNTPSLGDAHLHHERRIDSSAPRAAGGTVVDPLPYLPEP
jgi:RHS repeat-associated protein